jgi:hypothetical protein
MNRQFERVARPRDRWGNKHGYRLVPAEPSNTVRTLRLTAKGNRAAFLIQLERIQRIKGGGCS